MQHMLHCLPAHPIILTKKASVPLLFSISFIYFLHAKTRRIFERKLIGISLIHQRIGEKPQGARAINASKKTALLKN